MCSFMCLSWQYVWLVFSQPHNQGWVFLLFYWIFQFVLLYSRSSPPSSTFSETEMTVCPQLGRHLFLYSVCRQRYNCSQQRQPLLSKALKSGGIVENHGLQGNWFGRCSANQRQYMKEMHGVPVCMKEQDGKVPGMLGRCDIGRMGQRKL